MCKRCDDLWLSITSTTFAGVSVIIAILLMGFTWHFEVHANRTLALAMVLFLALTGIVFLVTVYAAICGGRRSRGLITAFMTILFVGLVTFTACSIALQGKIIDMFQELWKRDVLTSDQKLKLEISLKCCGWLGNETRCELAIHSWNWNGCRSEIEKFLRDYDWTLGGSFLALAVLNLIPLILSIKLSVSGRKDFDT